MGSGDKPKFEKSRKYDIILISKGEGTDMGLRVKNGRAWFQAVSSNVQTRSRGGKKLTRSDEKKLLAVPYLDDKSIGVLAHRLFRPPSEIRILHQQVHIRAKAESIRRKQQVERFLKMRQEKQKNL